MIARISVTVSACLIVMLLFRHVSAASPAEIDITGSYTAHGKTSRGVTYTADVFISRMKNAYKIHWLMRNGGEISGVGVRQGDYFAVAYQHDAGNAGVILNHIASKSTLIGPWTTEEGEGRVASETLTRD